MSEQEPLTDEDLEAMARRAAAASPAPWWAWVEGRDGYGGDNVILIGPRDTDNELPDMYVNHVSAGGSQPAPVEDLDFIADARQDIPRLIAEVRRLRERSNTESIESTMEGTPDRITAKEILYGVLRGSILEIRMNAVRSNNEAVVVLANLIHNMPSQLEQAAADEDFRSILHEMWQRADAPGRAWLEHCLRANLLVDPVEWGA